MKNLIIATLMTVSASAAFAENDCPLLGEVAAAVMESRQSGIAISAVMGAIPPNTSPDQQTLFRAMILDAYASPRYLGDSARRSAVADFRNSIELMCYEAE